MQKLPPQQVGKQQVHTYSSYSSSGRLQVKSGKQLQKIWPSGVAYGSCSSEDWVETFVELTAPRLSNSLFSPSGVIMHRSFFFQSLLFNHSLQLNPTALRFAPFTFVCCLVGAPCSDCGWLSHMHTHQSSPHRPRCPILSPPPLSRSANPKPWGCK